MFNCTRWWVLLLSHLGSKNTWPSILWASAYLNWPTWEKKNKKKKHYRFKAGTDNREKLWEVLKTCSSGDLAANGREWLRWSELLVFFSLDRSKNLMILCKFCCPALCLKWDYSCCHQGLFIQRVKHVSQCFLFCYDTENSFTALTYGLHVLHMA